MKKYLLKKKINKYSNRESFKGNSQVKKESFFWLLLILTLFCIATYYAFLPFALLTLFEIFTLIVLIRWILINEKIKKELDLYQRGENIRNEKLLMYIENEEQAKRQVIESIILKDEGGYDIKRWSVGKSNNLIIGKHSRRRVDIDLTFCAQSKMVSKLHAILNKGKDGWYIEDLNSKNGTGILKKVDNRKVKVEKGPVKVEKGDILYIVNTKLLLK